MKLLIDEIYPPAVAEQLRKAGHDAVSVQDDPNVRGLDDPALCGLALMSGRAFVTENAGDLCSTDRGNPPAPFAE